MKKKICYLDEDGRFGGPQQRMIMVAKELCKNQNFDIQFLIPSRETGFFKKKLKLYGLNYDEKNLTRLSINFNTLIKYIIFFIYEVVIIRNYLKKKNFDSLQVNSTSQFKGIIASLFLKIDCIWVIEDTNLGIITKYLFLTLAKCSKCKIIYTSRAVKNYYLKNQKINNIKKEIFAPVDPKIFNFKRKFKKLNFKKKNKLLITSVSGIIPVKGVESFLKIAEEILKKNRNVQFLLVGNIVSSQKRYSKKILKKISKIDKKNFKYVSMSSDIPNLLLNTDIFICTSLSEAGPLTVYEALMMRVPIITTNVGAIPQILKKNKSSLVCEPKNNNDMIKATQKMLDNIEYFKAMTKQSQTEIKIFNLSYVANQYKKVYKMKPN